MVELTKHQSEFLTLLPVDTDTWGLGSAYLRGKVRKLQKQKAHFRSSSS